MAFQAQTHGAIGLEDHGDPLGRRLAAEDLDDRLVEKLDAGATVRWRTMEPTDSRIGRMTLEDALVWPVQPRFADWSTPPAYAYTSRFRTSSACFSMNSRRGSTLSPIRMRNRSSAAPASSMRDLQQRAVGRVERRFAELLGVHFAQAFEAGDLQALFAGGADGRPAGRGGLPGRSPCSPRRSR